MPRDREVPPSDAKDAWEWVKSRSVAAIEGLIAYKAQTVSLKAVANRPSELPARKMLVVDPTGSEPSAKWSRQTFYLVDAETSRARKPRHYPVFLMFPPKPRRVVVEVTPEARAAVRGAARVRVMYSDDVGLDLLRQLRTRLQETTRGPRLLDLWATDSLPAAQAVEGLNPAQAQAFSAMTTAGGWLIWGPPGTGKTTVIVKAVAESLALGRSVLIASHTHVAVDNVVKDLADVVDEAGEVVRIGNPKNIDQQVKDHHWLILDKAAAVLTNREVRLQDILDQQASIESHPARQELDSVADRLADVDVVLIKNAYIANDHAERARELAASTPPLRAELTRVQRQIDQATAQMEAESTTADQLPTLLGLAARIEEGRRQLASGIAAAESADREFNKLCDEVVREMSANHAERGRWSSKMLGRRGELDMQYTTLTNALDGIVSSIKSNAATLEDLRGQYRTADSYAQQCAKRIALAESASRRCTAYREQLDVLERAHERVNARLGEINDEADRELIAADVVAGYAEIICRAEADGVPDLFEQLDRLNELVGRLDDQAEELEQEKKRLEDEYMETKRTLLESAPVIACTLSALTTNSELSNRRFDTVIVDEAASAHISQLVYAGAKSDRCLAFVGDFLQNSPITDVDDATTDEAVQLLPWQRDDIFALLGIHNRATAEAHPRCIALRAQYRYPQVIADIVNEFCYDGLLETAWNGTINGPAVTFIDTSAHPRQGLRSEGASWSHPLGLEMLDALFQNRTTGTIGLVCPYTAHAGRAESHCRARGYDMPCGTSHKFQGRQFDTVILDLMQDGTRMRWAAQADLAGGRRQVSAAKLLNVAITRTKDRLFIIGDWNFVRRTRTPGMLAIARLRTQPEFELVQARDILEADELLG